MINDDDEDDDYEEPVKKGKDKIAGKDCDIYESGYAEDGERYFEKMWIWKGIPLKIETETKSQIMTIKSDTTAVKVDIKNISSSQFTIPSGYKENTEASRGFEAFDNMMKMLGE